MSRTTLVLLLLCAAMLGAASPAQATTMSYLDNGVVKVGVDLDRGGLIVYLAPSGAPPSANLVDATTLGDGIQPWFQAGNGPYENPAPPFESNPWNPSVGGDAYGHPSSASTYEFSNDGTTIHTETYPKQWALNGESCSCEIEQWITLAGAAVHLRVRLHQYPYSDDSFARAFRDQELPAVHLASSLNRLFAYTGDAPYTGDALTAFSAGSTQQSATASESWAALVDPSGSGVGVIHPGITRFAFAAGFLAPLRAAVIFPKDPSDYEDESTIVLGTVPEIRGYAAAHHPDYRPDYRFAAGNGRGWSRWNGSPSPSTSLGLSLVPSDADSQLVGPDEWFRAADVPTLYVRGAWHTHDTLAQLFWRAPGSDFSESRSVRFRVVNDGRMHTYAVPLSGQLLWQATISQLRFDPVCCSESDSLVDLASISWRPDPTAIPVALEHARQLELRLVRDRKHRFGALGRLVEVDTYLPCISHVRIRLQRLVSGSWIPAKTLYTGTGGEFKVALPPKSRSHYRAVADVLTFPGNVCAAISATA